MVLRFKCTTVNSVVHGRPFSKWWTQYPNDAVNYFATFAFSKLQHPHFLHFTVYQLSLFMNEVYSNPQFGAHITTMQDPIGPIPLEIVTISLLFAFLQCFIQVKIVSRQQILVAVGFFMRGLCVIRCACSPVTMRLLLIWGIFGNRAARDKERTNAHFTYKNLLFRFHGSQWKTTRNRVILRPLLDITYLTNLVGTSLKPMGSPWNTHGQPTITPWRWQKPKKSHGEFSNDILLLISRKARCRRLLVLQTICIRLLAADRLSIELSQ